MTVDWTRYNYLTLGTRRRDGRRVFTPIWFAAASDGFFAFSSGDAGKVKRLRNFSDVEIAPCTVTGKPLAPAVDTRAVLLTSDADIQRALDALHMRYGWQMRLVDCGAKLTGSYHKRAYLRIEPPAASAQP